MNQNKNEFRVGDVVKGLGMKGTVESTEVIGDYKVAVRWRTFSNMLTHFTRDGRYHLSGEPCLELLERPKKKQKKDLL